jgi:hypothetical protein
VAKVALIRSEMPSLSVVEDASSNSFVFVSDAATDFTNISAVFTQVIAFYNTVASGSGFALSHYMGLGMDRVTNHCTMLAYDITSHLAGTPHGSPVGSTSWTLGAAASSSVLPSGLAAAISYRADYGTDVEFAPGARPRARDRARTYLGPLNQATVGTESVTSRCILTPSFVNDCLHALAALEASIVVGSETWDLAVWSRKNASTKFVVEAYMDDRFDYQRRRSDPNPASRSTLLI